MKSHSGLRRRGMIGRALLAAIIGAAFASPPAVAQSGLRQAMTKADDLIALYDAIDHTSPVCKGYVGKVVSLHHQVRQHGISLCLNFRFTIAHR